MLLYMLLAACSGQDADSAVPPGDLVTVVETATGRLLVADAASGAYEGEICLHELLPEDCPREPVDEDDLCQIFSSEHILEGGESTWLLSYVMFDSEVNYTPGRLAQLRPTHPPEIVWQVSGLSFAEHQPEGMDEACLTDLSAGLPICNLNATHTVVADGDVLVVADTNNARVLWLEKPAAGHDGPAEVLAILDDQHADWQGWRSINNVQLLTEGDRKLLLTTFKSAGAGESLADTGAIVLWDVTDPAAAALQWVYPETGFVAAVHHGQVQQTAYGESWLIYSHSLGASTDPDDGVFGSVGMARYNGTAPPEYLADGVLGVIDKSLGFVREAEIPPPYDWLLITDSGCENPQADCSLEGRVVSVALPEVSPSGRTGAFGDQEFVTMRSLPDAFQHEMAFPYEADMLRREEVGAVVADGLGACE